MVFGWQVALERRRSSNTCNTFGFHERSSLPVSWHVNASFRTLAVPLKNKLEWTPTALEYEASRALRRQPIIPLRREEMEASCKEYCRLWRDHCKRGARKKERGESKSRGEMTEVFVSGPYRVFLACFVYNWSCGVWCSATQNCNNSFFLWCCFDIPKADCWPGTVTLSMIYCAVEYTLH